MAKRTQLEELFVLPPGSPKTFSHDDNLPSLPLPTLEQTLAKYVESVRPFVSDEEFANTQRIIKEFEQGLGRNLHAKLKHRADTQRNWVESWWEEHAYLRIRSPLIPHCSMMGIALTEGPLAGRDLSGQPKLKEVSLYMHHLTAVWKMLRNETMKPTQGADGTHFSMVQFRRLFNTSRLPGSPADKLVSYFRTESEGACPNHVLILCRGRMFVVPMLDPRGNTLSPEDWEDRLVAIETACRHHEGPGVGVLTCDDRDTWAKNRSLLEALSAENRATLELIDSAVCVVTLDVDQPTTDAEVALKSLAGDFSNCWADKSMALLSFSNGNLGGLCDHTAFDGMISVASMYYCYLAMKQTSQPRGRWVASQPVHEITLHLDQQLREEISAARQRLASNHTLVVTCCERFVGYGKQKIQSHRLHPDSYVQMALQLAYVRLHHKPPPTYETATTRVFYNGRTETVRACTPASMAWVQSMLHPTPDSERSVLLREAVKVHDRLMKEGRENAGCDRHLFGLYCVALEEGLPLPDIYSDPAYAKSGGGGNFALSTSLVGYTPIGGGVAPMCRDGYGIFYNISPDILQFSIIAFRESPESSAAKLFTNIALSLEEMMSVLGEPAKL